MKHILLSLLAFTGLAGAAPLTPGMRVVESASSDAGIKATAFLSAKRELVVHFLNRAIFHK